MHAHLAEKSLASLGNFVEAFGEKGPCSTCGQQGTPLKVLFGERPQCCELPAEPEVLMMLIVRPRLTHHGSSVISLCGAGVEWTRIYIADSTNEAAAFIAATHPWGDGTYVEPSLITASLSRGGRTPVGGFYDVAVGTTGTAAEKRGKHPGSLCSRFHVPG